MSNALAGLNRGGFTIVKELKPETIHKYTREWLLVDPKEDRAARMAVVLRDKFPTLEPRPLALRVQDTLALSRADDAVVLAVDTIADTRAALEARFPSQRVHFQIVGRGPGGVVGTRIALQGTLCPGDAKTQRSVSLLLSTLEAMSRAASSRELTGPDPVFAAVVQPLRQAAARLTCLHLSEKEREPWDLSGGPVSAIFSQTVSPLIAVEGGSLEKYSQQTALALESAGALPSNTVIKPGLSGGMVVVAVVIPQALTVHFMRVALSSCGKRSVAGVTSFVSPALQRAASSDSAVFTD